MPKHMSVMCSVEGCDRWAQYRVGPYCLVHYLRMRKYGRTHLIVNRGSGFTMHPSGYIYIFVDGKPIGEHVHVAEQALGKKLPKGAEVHHVNGIKWDNCPTNLVVCPDQAYHKLLHKRMKELGYACD